MTSDSGSQDSVDSLMRHNGEYKHLSLNLLRLPLDSCIWAANGKKNVEAQESGRAQCNMQHIQTPRLRCAPPLFFSTVHHTARNTEGWWELQLSIVGVTGTIETNSYTRHVGKLGARRFMEAFAWLTDSQGIWQMPSDLRLLHTLTSVAAATSNYVIYQQKTHTRQHFNVHTNMIIVKKLCFTKKCCKWHNGLHCGHFELCHFRVIVPGCYQLRMDAWLDTIYPFYTSQSVIFLTMVFNDISQPNDDARGWLGVNCAHLPSAKVKVSQVSFPAMQSESWVCVHSFRLKKIPRNIQGQLATTALHTQQIVADSN